MKLSSLSLKNTLVALSIATFVGGVAEAYVAMSSVYTLSQGSKTLYIDIIPGISHANAMNTALGDIRIAESEHILAQGAADQTNAEAKLSKAVETFRKEAQIYKDLMQPDAKEERELFSTLEASFEKYSALDRRFLELSRKDTPETDKAAGALYSGEMKAVYDPAGEGLDKLIAINARDAAAADAGNDAAQNSAILLASLISVVLLGASALAGLFAFFGVSRPIGRITGAMSTLATGATDTAVPFLDRTNEIGKMAQAVEVFRINMIEAERLRAADAAEQDARQRRANVMDSLIKNFDRTVTEVVGTVSSAATEMQATAQQLTATAAVTAEQSGKVASASEEASSNVHTVAAAAEELGSSVQEIGRQVSGASELAQTAVAEAAQTATLVNELSKAAASIGDVVALISSIAQQTNLLALNATIEAARAGEAGRGFAVVAAEVKELAAQTARATGEIEGQIGSIQGSTEQAVSAIGSIRERIQQISSVSTSISAAVEEQGAATQEIVRNVGQAAVGTSEVTTTIAGVASAAEETGAAASQVLSSASELSRQSEHLGTEVGRFLEAVRAA